jgi:hypothetical protein
MRPPCLIPILFLLLFLLVPAMGDFLLQGGMPPALVCFLIPGFLFPIPKYFPLMVYPQFPLRNVTLLLSFLPSLILVPLTVLLILN